MNIPDLIAISGVKGSGKSLTAEAIKELASPNVVKRLSFALPMRLMLVSLGVPSENVFGDQQAKNEPLEAFGGVTVRHLLQTLGTDWGRNMINPNIWVNAAQRMIQDNVTCVFDDLRFPNEACMIRQNGGLIISVRCQGAEEQAKDQHESEAHYASLPYDILIENHERTSPEEAKAHIKKILEEHFTA